MDLCSLQGGGDGAGLQWAFLCSKVISKTAELSLQPDPNFLFESFLSLHNSQQVPAGIVKWHSLPRLQATPHSSAAAAAHGVICWGNEPGCACNLGNHLWVSCSLTQYREEIILEALSGSLRLVTLPSPFWPLLLHSSGSPNTSHLPNTPVCFQW